MPFMTAIFAKAIDSYIFATAVILSVSYYVSIFDLVDKTDYTICYDLESSAPTVWALFVCCHSHLLFCIYQGTSVD